MGKFFKGLLNDPILLLLPFVFLIISLMFLVSCFDLIMVSIDARETALKIEECENACEVRKVRIINGKCFCKHTQGWILEK